ncbi:energy transducer TonB [Terriglobus tenax]|uniref:energy transducer TonB n=1 Tax=Terriglobus tenax TaxID=1111115 RepID=UPI0021E010D7|nr:energy transducer TonB [Terriglobus tenax]
MLESALIESTGRIRTTRRYTAIASVGLQILIGAGCIVYPLIYPEALPKSATKLLSIEPPMMTRAPQIVTQQQAVSSRPTPMVDNALHVPPTIPTNINETPDPTPPGTVIAGSGLNMSGPTGPSVIGSVLSNIGSTPAVVTVIPRPKPIVQRVSEGVTRGLLLKPITPLYPAIARAAGVQGNVVVSAVISKSGSVESLQVVSGPEMLRNAALEAIRAARYQPYLLNGEPTEVQTTITIHFTMGS